MKILTTLVLHSHECRAEVRDKIRKTVARNSHASEILAEVLTMTLNLNEGLNECVAVKMIYIYTYTLRESIYYCRMLVY